MNRLFEILGRAITVDTSDLIWQWIKTVRANGYGGSGGGAEEPERLDDIIALVDRRKYRQADQALRVYLFDNPDSIVGRLAAAAMCLHDNKLEAAIEQLNSVYMRQVSNTMALYSLGYCYERLGKEAEAVEFYQDCLKFKNYLQLPRQRLAAIFFKNNQLKKTIREYELLRGEYPDDIFTLVTLGYLYIAQGKYEVAIERFNSAILMHPDNLHTEQEEIDTMIIEGRYYEALEAIDNCMDDQPVRIDLLIKKADVLSGAGEEEQALCEYEEALQICPDSLEASIKLGTHYLKAGQTTEAAKLFNQAAEINDRIVDAYIGLAIAEKLGGNFSEALGILSLAAAIVPNSSLLFAETARLQMKAYISRGVDDEQQQEVNLMEMVVNAHLRQIQVRPDNPDLFYRLGILMMNLGRLENAVEAFQKGLELNPGYSRARNKLAICLLELDRKPKALDELAGIENLDRDTLELHYRTALLYCDKVKFASSVLNLERSLEKNYTNVDATDNISVVLQNLGLLDRAELMWDNLEDVASSATGGQDSLFPGDF